MDASSFRAATAGFDWRLTELNGRSAPTGAGGRAATVHFDADTARVSGFAGCNRYFGAYTLAGTTLRFHQIGMTKMACSEGMPLEQQLAAALQATRSYELSGTTLTLRSDEGPVARFVRAAP